MPYKIGVLVIHGMGSQKPGYSTPMVQAVTNLLADDGDQVLWKEIYWADILSGRETDLWNVMDGVDDSGCSPSDLNYRKLREFILDSFGDAVAYYRDGSQTRGVYHHIHRAVHRQVEALHDLLESPQSPVVVIAHSLGGHIMSNYLWDQQHVPASEPSLFAPINNLVGFITMGCNIPLFSLAFPEAHPVDIPGRDIQSPELIELSRWLNFYDKDDVFGWPIIPMYQKNLAALLPRERETMARIRDHQITVGTAFTRWNPLSHAAYWTDSNFTTPVAEFLGNLIDALR